MFEIQRTSYYEKWYSKQEAQIKGAIDSRITFVIESGILVNARYLGEKLFEFKWKIGIRVYFTILKGKIIFLLCGGRKNGQEKDIKKARDLCRAIALRS